MTKINKVNSGKKVSKWGGKKTIKTEYDNYVPSAGNKNYSWVIMVVLAVILALCIIL